MYSVLLLVVVGNKLLLVLLPLLLLFMQSFISWCDQNPCRNGANCTQLANRFTCICESGWTGALCDVGMVSCNAAASQKGMGSCNGFAKNCRGITLRLVDFSFIFYVFFIE